MRAVAPSGASAEHLRLFVEEAPVATAMFNRNMRYLAASARYRAEYGLGEASLAGRSCYEVQLSGGPAGGERFELSWTEEGGPQVSPPRQAGFGTVVIDEIPRTNFDAEVALDYAKEGFRWRLSCPAESVLDASSSAG